MPCTLALETSTAQGSVAVWREGKVIFEKSFTSERSHNSQLFAPLGEALSLCGDDLQRIVIGLGPGSYTGVRIGIAAAQGISWSRNVPVIGLPSVIGVEDENFILCGDARRGAYFTARIADGWLSGEIIQHDAAAFKATHEAESGLVWYSFDAKVPLGLEGVILIKPSAAVLAKRAAALPDESIFALEEQPLEPVYLSAPFITMPKKASSPSTVTAEN
jgi:tRNA threonylcarbamoyl adenosine modification protein YeaZ